MFCCTFVFSTVFILAIGAPPIGILLGAAGIAVTYGVLQIGPPSSWSQMDPVSKFWTPVKR